MRHARLTACGCRHLAALCRHRLTHAACAVCATTARGSYMSPCKLRLSAARRQRVDQAERVATSQAAQRAHQA